jgi:hypothetical protein
MILAMNGVAQWHFTEENQKETQTPTISHLFVFMLLNYNTFLVTAVAVPIIFVTP